jgi:hypothetical protein
MIIVSADTDGDGIPDLWETAHGLNPNAAGDALTDDDGDGIANLQEYLANTDPHDSTSFLAVTELAADGPDLLLSFSTAHGKTYRLDGSSTSPNGPWTVLMDGVAGTGDVVVIRLIGANGAADVFFRVTVDP